MKSAITFFAFWNTLLNEESAFFEESARNYELNEQYDVKVISE